MENNIKLKIDNNKELECLYEGCTISSYVSFCPQIESVFTVEDLESVGGTKKDIANHKDWYSIEIEDLINNGFSFKITPITKKIITLS